MTFSYRPRVRPCLVAALALVAATGGCASRTTAPVGTPAPDPAGLAAELVRGTMPARPQQVAFNWSLNEAGSRVNGRGVVRAVAPRRIRLDLFGPRNETYLSAALVDGAYRLPRGVPDRVTLPSPVLLWAGLGAVSPPEGAELVGATSADSAATLRYRAPGGDLYHFVFRGAGGAARLDGVERMVGGNRVESVDLSREPDGRVRRAQYRNWGAYRELVLDIQEIKDVPSFPETIWQP